MADYNNVYDDLPPGFRPMGATSPSAPPMSNESYSDLPEGFQPLQAPQQPMTPNYEMNTFDRGMAPANAMLQGAMLGFWDEAKAGLASGIEGAQNMFGYGYNQDKDLGQKYDYYLEKARAQDEQWRTEHPYIDAGLQVAGGMLTGGIGAAKSGAVKGGSLVSRMLRGGAVGTATGGAAGFGYGEGGFKERADNAVGPALVGGAIGTAAPAVIQGIEAAAKSRPVQETIQRAGRKLAEERGSTMGITPPALAKEDVALARILRDVNPDKLQKSAAIMNTANRKGHPMYLAEAIDDPQVYQDARYYANTRGGRDFAQKAIDERSLGQSDRLGRAFDLVSKESNTYNAGKGIQKAASDLLEAAKAERARIVDPMYKQAYKSRPTVNSKILHYKDPTGQHNQTIDKIMTSPAIKRITRRLRELPEYEDLPDNSAKLVNRVLGELNEQINSAVAQGKSVTIRDLMSLKSPLEKEIEAASPALKMARLRFEELSPAVDRKLNGMLGELSDLADGKLHLAGKKIMNLHPEKIKELQGMLGAEHAKEFRGAIRAYMQDIVNNNVDGRNALRKIIKSPEKRQVLETALGAKRYQALKRRIDFEDKIHGGKLQYNTGPRTQTNITTEKEQKELLESVANIFRNPVNGASRMLKNAFEAPEDELLTSEISKIFFDPQAGYEALKRIIPFRSNQDAYFKAIEDVLNKSQGATERGLITGVAKD